MIFFLNFVQTCVITLVFKQVLHKEWVRKASNWPIRSNWLFYFLSLFSFSTPFSWEAYISLKNMVSHRFWFKVYTHKDWDFQSSNTCSVVISENCYLKKLCIYIRLSFSSYYEYCMRFQNSPLLKWCRSEKLLLLTLRFHKSHKCTQK